MNWWAPRFLGRLVDRLGFSHDEDHEPNEPNLTPSPSPGLAEG
jgi:hypothetical protein